MNSNRPALLSALLWSVGFSLAWANDWKTSDGKVYEDVKLIRLDPDTVTILDKEGGARIPLAKLSPDLQKRFGYDPDLAKAAADARAKAAALDAKELQAEMNKASEMHQAGPETTSPNSSATATSEDGTGPVTAESPHEGAASAASSGTHHFMDEITASASGKKPDVADASHHSIDDTTQTATAMRRDLSDPTYHTMAHLFYTVRTTGLSAEPADTTHHTMDEVTGQK